MGAADTYSAAREQMIRLIEQDVRETSIYLEKSALDERILKSLGEVPRHQFVPADVRSRAYDNRPLPIGYGQTISQPYIVAIMTDLIAPRAEHKALEIGTGSGYQAAVLSRLVEKVYTMEIVEPLGKQATERLKRLGFDNIEVSIADGYYGWKEHAPFDIIIVTAAASHIPPPLIEQLKPGGKMIIPVGSRFMTQQLLLVDKNAEKEITVRQILPVRFVPLTGEH
ncbi:protein-L-isoaspartate(D-aspartate) O-methyltransferase [Candidatus Thiodiazotropha sp. LNASS1]|uniref:protein-L-isoaspartate(D-aspartate) O-methyltransferase n=1 Tax=Candidatus Thiodiazotropha sp. LNASS1 TaxID=3096260 RepID=UPI003498F470